MSEFNVREPSVLRPHLNEWAGGTKPPTIVTVDPVTEIARVDIYDNEKFVYGGEVGQPIHFEEILHSRDKAIDHDTITKYAGTAIAAYVNKQPK